MSAFGIKRTSVNAQAVTNPGLSKDISGTLRVRLDLLPELTDIDAQILSVSQIAPEFAQQEFVGEHLAGMLNQHTQQVIFLRGRLDLLIADFHDPPHQIDRKFTDPEDRSLAVNLQLMAQRRAHSGKKLVHSERLGNVIVSAGVKCLYLADLVLAAGKNHNRHAVVSRAHRAQKLVALHVGQAKIENDQIRRRLLAQEFKGHFATGCFHDLIAVCRKPDAQQLTNWRLVVDDKNPEGRGAHAAASSRSGSLAIGNLMVKTAPRRSDRLAARMVPFIASTKPREIARPSPVPGRIWSALGTR